MKAAYIFSTQGHPVSNKPGKMILHQLEEDAQSGNMPDQIITF